MAKDDQSEDLARAEQSARLERGIRLLPPHQRVPIVLYHFEERSYREIADALGGVARQDQDRHPPRTRGFARFDRRKR